MKPSAPKQKSAADKVESNQPETASKPVEEKPVEKPDAVETVPPVPTASTDAGAGSWEDLVDEESEKKEEAGGAADDLDWEDASFDVDVDFGDEPKVEVKPEVTKKPNQPPTKVASPSNKKKTAKKKKQLKKEKRQQKAKQKRQVESSDEDSESTCINSSPCWKQCISMFCLIAQNFAQVPRMRSWSNSLRPQEQNYKSRGVRPG